MSGKYDEYQRQAEYCQQMARRADTLESRASWLRLASKWLGLAEPLRQTTEAEKFEALVECRRTGQKDSSSKH
jgi:hypothetical protein